MQNKVEISTEVYEKLRKQPLFFIKFHAKFYYDNEGREHDNSLWESVDTEHAISFQAGSFGNREHGYCLCFAEKASYVQKSDSKGNLYTDKSRVNMKFHDVGNTMSDYYVCLDSCIRRSQNKDDKYFFMEILWLFDKIYIDENNLTGAIQKYDTRTIPYILDILRRIGRCLSVVKQQVIKAVVETFNGKYDIYCPQKLSEAISLIKKETAPNNKNLFQLIDLLFDSEYSIPTSELLDETSNPFLLLVKWLSNDDKLIDYHVLISLYSSVSERVRLKIVKRYFHDIRLGNTTFDIQLLQQFVNNRYDDFIMFRYCTETPSDSIILTVPLLCDNIITLYNTNGTAFQTFNGVLDFAMTHCDHVHPNIKFDLGRIIPTCEHSAVYNTEFKGFIDYQLVRKLNISAMDDQTLLIGIRKILDTYGTRLTYPVCRFGDDKEIDADTLKKCKCAFPNKEKYCSISEKHQSCEGIVNRPYEGKWIVDNKNKEILTSFISTGKSLIEQESCYYVNIEDVSVDVFRKYVCALPQKYQMLDDVEFLVPSYKNETYDLFLIKNYSDILRMRIVPQKGALVGKDHDVFGYWKTLSATLSESDKQNPKCDAYKNALSAFKEKESDEVYRRTIESLKEELGGKVYKEDYFETEYNREQLVKLIRLYYFKETLKSDDKDERRNFLTFSYTDNFKPYCAPELSKTTNRAINLPFFWCRGKECFHNNLSNQTLAEQKDWNKYSLYHIVEIIGFPKLHLTEGGYEPDATVRNFIATTNKAMQKFKRLKCRECGHLMFADNSIGFNRFNYYSCINPNCPEKGKSVYLNYCFKCKKGLIDSRDTKQCPNHWYICPTCLACCDDAQYERQAQRYILSNRPVPDRIKRMLNHGHNDKGEYFCPNCGSQLEYIQDEHGYSELLCPSCRKTFANLA